MFIEKLVMFSTVMCTFLVRGRVKEGCIILFPNQKTFYASFQAIVSWVRRGPFIKVCCWFVLLISTTLNLFSLLTFLASSFQRIGKALRTVQEGNKLENISIRHQSLAGSWHWAECARGFCPRMVCFKISHIINSSFPTMQLLTDLTYVSETLIMNAELSCSKAWAL